MKALRFLLLLISTAVALGASAQEWDNDAGPYVPTPWPIVDELVKLAGIGSTDTVYDLGSGDGRLVITAAKRFGARGVGIELKQELVDRANAQAREEGLEDRVRFIQGDLFEASFRDASVVTLYLLPRFVTRLVPKLREELKPGSRIVSHDYPLAPWPPDKTLSFEVDEKEAITGSKRTVLYYYVVPAPVGGDWRLELPKSLADGLLAMHIDQGIEAIEGLVRQGANAMNLRDPVVRGERIRFGLLVPGRLLSFTGTVSGDSMAGEVTAAGSGDRQSWTARRVRF